MSRGRGREMKPRHIDTPPYIRQDIPLRSDQALKIHKKLTGSFLNGQGVFDYWRLSKVETLENENFEMEYSQIRNDFLSRGFKPNEVTSSLGFLATTSEKMIDVSLRDGLCVKFSPINTLGYCIAGVHLSIHADVCLQEAAYELGGDVKDMILVAFKFMYGQRKPVTASYGPENTLISPTPGFNCHISNIESNIGDPLSVQHTRSFVYLYEFENEFFHPRERPRHCCPTAALHFKRVKPLPPQPFEAGAVPQNLSLANPPPVPGTVIPGISAAVQTAVNLVTSDPALRKVLETVAATNERTTAPTADNIADPGFSKRIPPHVRDNRVGNPIGSIPGLSPFMNKHNVEHPPLISEGQKHTIESPDKQKLDPWMNVREQIYPGRQRGYQKPPGMQQQQLQQQQQQQQFHQQEPPPYSQGHQQYPYFSRPEDVKNAPRYQPGGRPQQQNQFQRPNQFQQQKGQVRKNPYVKANNQPWRPENQQQPQQQQGDVRYVKLKDNSFSDKQHDNRRQSGGFSDAGINWQEEFDSDFPPNQDQPPPVLRHADQDSDDNLFSSEDVGGDDGNSYARKRPLLGDGGPGRDAKQPRGRMMNPYVQRPGVSPNNRKPQETFKRPNVPPPMMYSGRGRGRGRGGGYRGKPGPY